MTERVSSDFTAESVTLNEHGYVVARPAIKVRRVTEDLGPNAALILIEIPAGRFQMGSPPGQGADDERPVHPVSVGRFFMTQSLVTQALYYLGDMGARGGDEMTNMDMAKHLIDTLGVLEDKTKGNLSPEEQQFLDTALYESRMRFISTAGQVIAGS